MDHASQTYPYNYHPSCPRLHCSDDAVTQHALASFAVMLGFRCGSDDDDDDNGHDDDDCRLMVLTL